jgi:uncharacterized protein GlcG (DUF336 family)
MKATWLLLFAALPAFAQSQAVVTERSISLDAAREAALGALERCRRDGYQVTVTVLNRSGRTKVVLHDDRVGPHTLENSFKKAYTTITFRGEPSGDFGRRVAKNPPPHPQLHLGNVTTAEGALPIRIGDDVIGAIGVSGAPGGDKDAVCAQAGIERIAKELGR